LTEIKASPQLRRVYYGWTIVILSFVSMSFWFGVRASFSVFYVALLEEFHWSRGESAGVQSMAMLTYTFIAPLVGGLIDRLGPRRVIVPGIILLVAGLVLCSSMKSLFQFYLFYGVLAAAGSTCIAIVAYSAILAHWFERKRGLASGIAVSGMGFGTFLLVPLSQSLISSYGWRPTFVILAGLVLLIALPLNLLFLKHKPAELGLRVDGIILGPAIEDNGPQPAALINTQKDWTLREVIRTRSFWALLAFPFFALIGVYIVVVHNVRFMVDKGIDPMTAALIFALAGMSSSIFRIFWGWISDHIGREKAYTMGMGCLFLGACSLLLMDALENRAFIYTFFIFFGMGWGATAPLFMATAADLFKGRTFGLIYGIVEGVLGFGGGIGAWSAGFIFDQTKSYRLAFVLVIVMCFLSCFFMWIAAPRKARKRVTSDGRLNERST
jgi:OFA family oxalate/formate antiporter-like MFS transporter